MPLPSLSGYPDVLVATAGGYVRTTEVPDAGWTTPSNLTGNDPPLNTQGLVYGSVLNGNLHMVDGTHYAYLNYATKELRNWTATAGSLPTGEDDGKARLIEAHGGRIVLAGVLSDPNNFWMSRVLDAFDFDVAPESPDEQQAIVGASGNVGQPGDVIHSLCSYRDDLFYLFCRQSMYQIAGDPGSGGRMTLVADGIGSAWGRPWVQSPDGTLWFFGQEPGVYSIVPGGTPVFRSLPVQKWVRDLDMNDTIVTMAWNRKRRELHVWLSPLTAPQTSTHLCFESQTGAWWIDRFADPGHDPLCTTVFNGDVVLGCWDGYVRKLDANAATDDGQLISSTVVIGPILTRNMDDMLLKEVQAAVAANSGAVTFDVLAGDTPEQALASTPVYTGTWQAGRNLTDLTMFSGHAIYLRLSSTNRWAYEQVRAVFRTLGENRRRGY